MACGCGKSGSNDSGNGFEALLTDDGNLSILEAVQLIAGLATIIGFLKIIFSSEL